MMMSQTSTLALLGVLLSLNLTGSQAVTLSIDWTKDNQTPMGISVGDSVVFSFSDGQTLHQFTSETAFTSCDFKQAEEKKASDGKFTFKAEKPGPVYFGSKSGCTNGHKVQLQVIGSGMQSALPPLGWPSVSQPSPLPSNSNQGKDGADSVNDPSKQGKETKGGQAGTAPTTPPVLPVANSADGPQKPSIPPGAVPGASASNSEAPNKQKDASASSGLPPSTINPLLLFSCAVLTFLSVSY